ncbi:MAG: hydroxyacylglutathione hydrolase [Alphaproteobacteria bacterium]|nr:hydroxyacylglutathione hydrolase [Alphaproteobacteria bacterium]
MSDAEWIRIPALSDNYIWMLHNPSSKELAIVDPGDASAVIETLDARGLTPTVIVNTHHHFDHTDGNAELMEKYTLPLIAPAAETARIAGITTTVDDGDRITIAGYDAEVITTPGHTTGHVAFYLPDCFGASGVVFVGDNLFSLGCGRVFEGTMDDMWSSLEKLRALPDDTLVCGGHEYSAANALYVESLDWARPEAAARIAEIRALRAADKPTLPVRLGDEKRANPFLNGDAEDLAAALGMAGQSATAVFTALREGKDRF